MAKPMFAVERSGKVSEEWPGHDWRGYSTWMRDTQHGLVEFLAAPARAPRMARCDGFNSGGGGWTNGDIVNLVMGTKGAQAFDGAIFDAVSEKYEKKCRTFAEAFRACARPCAGSYRDWRDLDIGALRECHPAFRALELPEWVSEMLSDIAIGEEAERFYGNVADEPCPF